MSPRFGQTPSQTAGPYFSMRLGGEGQNVLPAPAGSRRIVITGSVFDGDGNPVEDALIETWQANPAGRYNHPDDTRDIDLSPGFTGFARAVSDFETGGYRIETVKPGRVPDPEGSFQSPHISLILQARGMLNQLYTRIYFSDEEEANQDDLILRRIPTPRRQTLIAQLVEGSDPPTYTFDIRIQGEDETVFFDV
jgi:protocatechuate 3,4-dioxygenase alpha subunit